MRRYLMIVFVSVSLLFGIQVPNFLDQYDHRVDAHLQEVSINIQRYQDIADKYHNGDLNVLIALHRSSLIPTYKDEGVVIEDMYHRRQRFKAARLAATSNYFWKTLHVIKNGDRELIQETMDKYSYAVPLNQDAVVSGVILAVTVTLLVEVLFGLLGFIIGGIRKRRSLKSLAKIQQKQSAELRATLFHKRQLL
jgi:hypothetical protein